MSSTEISEMIDALNSGAISLDEVAERFRHRAWSRSRRPEPETYEQMAAETLRDPEPFVLGSYDEVTAAYDRGELTSDQYQVLSEAVAEAINAEARREAE
jgi:hypothetical protein